MLKIVLAFPLLMQGFANMAGVVASWSSNPAGFSNSTWLLSNSVTLRSPVGRATGVLWLLSTIILITAGLGLLGSQAWWRADPPGAKFGAVFNIVEIAVLLSPLGEQVAQLVR